LGPVAAVALFIVPLTSTTKTSALGANSGSAAQPLQAWDTI